MLKTVLLLAMLVALALTQQCKISNVVGLNQPCNVGTTMNHPALVNVTQSCTTSLTCDPKKGVCRQNVALGTACTDDANCTSTIFPLSTASLKCLNNKCGYKKHEGLSCTANSECFTGICSNSTCSGLPLGASCASNTNGCYDFNTTQLLCHSVHKNCTARGALNDACTTNTDCRAGYVCTGNKCVSGIPTVGTTCSSAAQCTYRNLPLGLTCYPNGKCNYPNQAKNNEACSAGNHCVSTLGCLNNKCIVASNVTCLAGTSFSSGNCGSSSCLCPNGAGNTGHCNANQDVGKIQNCTAHLPALASCLARTCPTADLNKVSPFDPKNCAALCFKEATNYLCCLKEAVGSSFVDPPLGVPLVCPTNPGATTQPPSTTQAPTTTPGTSSASKSMFSVALLVLSLVVLF